MARISDTEALIWKQAQRIAELEAENAELKRVDEAWIKSRVNQALMKAQWEGLS